MDDTVLEKAVSSSLEISFLQEPQPGHWKMQWFLKIMVNLIKIVCKNCTVGVSTRFKLIKLNFLENAG